MKIFNKYTYLFLGILVIATIVIFNFIPNLETEEFDQEVIDDIIEGVTTTTIEENSEQNTQESISSLDELVLTEEEISDIDKVLVFNEFEKEITNFDVYLLIGSDERSAEIALTRGEVTGKRADVIILGLVDKSSKEITLLSFPRDLLIKNNCTGKLERINAAYSKGGVAAQQEEIARRETVVSELETVEPSGDKKEDKKHRKALGRARDQLTQACQVLESLKAKIQTVENDEVLLQQAQAHPEIARNALLETAQLHEGDATNRQLWEEFLPKCREDIQRVYARLSVEFDVEYGESFYHEMLPGVVSGLQEAGLASESEGAQCVFLDDFETPMIVQKSDGAFLYATTDLATIEYRMQQWQADEILYVVDHRQSEHFQKLFAVANAWNAPQVQMHHISFGTVLDESGRPYKTRSGDAVGLEGLLDEAVNKAYEVVSANDDSKPNGSELSEETRRHIADVVGHGAIKYADLSHNRTSDYVFSYDKMMALEGNTATYMQYSYARVQSIFRKGDVDLDALRQSASAILLGHAAERALAMMILRYSEALEQVVEDYRPNQLTNYLFDLAKRFSSFFEQCPVLKSEDEAIKQSRLKLCDLTGRVIAHGLDLLGIGVVDQM